MLVKILQQKLVENRVRLIPENIQISTQRDEIRLQLSGDVLSLATRADTVACAVVAVPVLVSYDFIDVVFVIGSQTKGAKLAFALIFYSAFLN